jgi:hypothetical protein
VITIGLVIASPWIEKILAGEKSWEIRSTSNLRSERIALCEKGGPIVATAVIAPSIRIAPGDFDRYFDKHRVPADVLAELYGGDPVFAWPLSDVRRLDPPVEYEHVGGGSWVTLSAGSVREFERLQRP